MQPGDAVAGAAGRGEEFAEGAVGVAEELADGGGDRDGGEAAAGAGGGLEQSEAAEFGDRRIELVLRPAEFVAQVGQRPGRVGEQRAVEGGAVLHGGDDSQPFAIRTSNFAIRDGRSGPGHGRFRRVAGAVGMRGAPPGWAAWRFPRLP
ncbi:hypothetical protein GCM10025734_34120 [Kitasatospora paranensis]